MRQIGFQYSNDGVTWSTALVIDCLLINVYYDIETNHTNGWNKRKHERVTTYLNIDIETTSEAFDPAATTTADADLKTIQEFLRAKLRRIYNADTTNFPNFDGFTDFNTNPNTNYLNVLDYELLKFRQDLSGTNTQKIRRMKMYLQTRDKVV